MPTAALWFCIVISTILPLAVPIPRFFVNGALASASISCKFPEIDTTGLTVVNPSLDMKDTGKTFPPGSEINFDCEDDYEMADYFGTESTIYCKRDGKWTAKPPKCIQYINYCHHPGVHENGVIEDYSAVETLRETQMYLPGAELKYLCLVGFELVGKSNLICTEYGEWSDDPPICKNLTTEMCREPLPIQNGGVTVYHVRTNMPASVNNGVREYSVGTQFSYDCKPGYRLQGDKDLFCLSTGLWSAERPVCAEDCGRSTVDAGGKVTYGTNTTAGEFPWIVFLYMNETKKTCGGVLINHTTVLTVAHCLEDAKTVTLYFGKYNNSDENDDKEVKTRTMRSSEIIRHPDYGPESFDNDIAIVKFSSDILYSPRIQPICMPSPDSTLMNIAAGQLGYIAGWGINEHQMISSRLMMASLPVQAPETCISAYSGRGTLIRITQGMFCASYADKKTNACRGDSGSPMAFYNYQTHRFILEGLVSHGTDGRCDKPEKYTVFTKVSKYLQWIDTNARIENRTNVDDTSKKRACKRITNCETCSTDLSYCLTCPPGRAGISCALVMCRDPGSLQNGGVIVYYKSRHLNDSDIDNVKDYPVGTRLYYDCKPGYRLEGERNLICKPNQLWDRRKPVCVQDCGISSLTTGGKINSGSTSIELFPWMVFIRINEAGEACGGVLLDHRTVLTVAHCLKDVSSCSLYFGKYNRRDKYDDSEVMRRTCSKIITHPEFSPVTFDNNIAIVKFSPLVPFSSRIQPICIPSPDSTDKNIVPGQMGYVIGWGLTEHGIPSSKLKSLTVPVQKSETCTSAYSRRGIRLTITQRMFCAGYADRPNKICPGDSGSPLVFYNNNTDRFVLEGIVSHGPNGCGLPEEYAMFTKVSHYIRWIYITIEI